MKLLSYPKNYPKQFNRSVNSHFTPRIENLGFLRSQISLTKTLKLNVLTIDISSIETTNRGTFYIVFKSIVCFEHSVANLPYSSCSLSLLFTFCCFSSINFSSSVFMLCLINKNKLLHLHAKFMVLVVKLLYIS